MNNIFVLISDFLLYSLMLNKEIYDKVKKEECGISWYLKYINFIGNNNVGKMIYKNGYNPSYNWKDMYIFATRFPQGHFIYLFFKFKKENINSLRLTFMNNKIFHIFPERITFMNNKICDIFQEFSTQQLYLCQNGLYVEPYYTSNITEYFNIYFDRQCNKTVIVEKLMLIPVFPIGFSKVKYDINFMFF